MNQVERIFEHASHRFPTTERTVVMVVVVVVVTERAVVSAWLECGQVTALCRLCEAIGQLLRQIAGAAVGALRRRRQLICDLLRDLLELFRVLRGQALQPAEQLPRPGNMRPGRCGVGRRRNAAVAVCGFRIEGRRAGDPSRAVNSIDVHG